MASPQTSPPPSERTPLLSGPEDDPRSIHSDEPNGYVAPPSPEPLDPPAKKHQQRWPSIVALTILCLVVVAVCFSLTLPSTIKEYAKEALVFEPTKLSIDSFTSLGIRARIQGDFYMDASRVHNKATRDLGRFGTWIAKEVKSGESKVNVYLPEYDNILLGTVTIPPIRVTIQNHRLNHLDFFADLEPGDLDGFRRLAKDFMDRRLDEITVDAVVTVSLQSGLIRLGKQTISQTLQFQGGDVPAVPDFDIQQLRFAEYGLPGHPEGVKAMATVSVMNQYPVKFDVPPLAFEVLLPDCSENYLLFGTARTDVIHILPEQNISASVIGLVKQLPTSLTSVCPGSKSSPLDSLVADYLAGRDTTVYIRGGQQDENTPDWIGKLLQETVLPFSLPGHPFDNLIKEFSLADVHFALPNPMTDSRPEISAIVKVLVGLPAEMNINLDVDRVRADADVFYKGELLGNLDLSKWQAANATQVDDDLLIQSIVKDAPLEIKNESLFSQVVQALIFGKGASLSVQATVDVNTHTALGEFVVRRIPAKGQIFIKPLRSGDFQMPEIKGMEVVATSETSLTLQARVNVTNPTDYSAKIPYCNVSIWVNDTRVGYAWASSQHVVPGPNNLTANASWEVGNIGREWLSQYISGYNTSLTIKSHAGSIPNFPDPGVEMTVPAPHMLSHPLREATMHIFSSTATFILVSPLAFYVTSITAAAFYNGSEVGTINWDYPFAIEPGENLTPRLPVEWGSNALGTIRDALGGTLKLDAKADVGVRIGKWQEHVWYEGKGLGAKIRL
ncbi:uncharacterized protein Z519_04096 [Cladophialophora bantiana CBS 173.52]|uniref:Pre-rRNA processing protein n=1 Tax=Cladophialophora bantiana (strain ATCC 10958 / CBS 173.52 / CDC B-1940 / NIH 8579) TaxID=1442370 RepID=A0A0D2F022_CLAB1|nr:uncharacterized protein Z519_04096 [Cladophialophora bantiana CBS 173.52]KIW95511.1 hypothetical protein Z519_04096 [Cladophialophora bantiana CBS 173.52]